MQIDNMTDIIDMASDREQLDRENSLRAARRAAERELLSDTGRCHFCDEETLGIGRFCDADCRDSWQREQAAKRRSGRSAD